MEIKQVHLIGIGGTGLSAIAQVLLESGVRVTGSDQHDSPLAQAVRAAGGKVYIGHRAENIQGADVVVRSSAIGDENVEVKAANEAGIPVLKRDGFLGKFMEGRRTIAVAGTHGKTTTTAMIAWMLTALGQDPSYIIGGVSLDLGTNAHAGESPLFVIEADEYDYMFLGLRPHIAVVTNVEHDHPDFFPTADVFYRAFLAFAYRVPRDGKLLICQDDPGAAQLLEDVRTLQQTAYSYGLQLGLDYSVEAIAPTGDAGYQFRALMPEGETVDVSLQVPGEHNARNALAALGVAHLLGLPLKEAALALSEYKGTGRRFEVKGEAAGVTVVDDYAHHPTEIRATLAAARERYPGRRIWAVWQPHTFSRTRTLLSDFVQSFADADQTVVTEIFAARESPQPDGFSTSDVIEAFENSHILFGGSTGETAQMLLDRVEWGDVVLVLSAGDADQVSRELLKRLSANSDGAEEII